MHSQVALLLQDAFLQAEDFSIPGIGSFSQQERPNATGIDIVFDPDESKAPSLGSYWEKDLHISAAAAAQKLSEMRVAIRWGLKTNDHFIIPEVGTLHQHQPGKLQFHSLLQTEEETVPVVAPIAEAEPEPEVSIIPMKTGSSKSYGNRMIGYVLIGVFALIGLLMVGQAIWGGDTDADIQSEDVKKAQQTALLEATDGDNLPQFAHTANYTHPESRVDSPLKPVNKGQIVSTSRPQDGSATSTQPGTTPTSRISVREVGSQTVPNTPNQPQGNADKDVVDIGVLDTLRNGMSNGQNNTRIASRSQTINKPAPTTEARNQYHLIAGSFANYQAAQAFVTEMRQQGSQPIVLPANEQSHMQYRVSIFHHITREEVAKHKQALIQTGKKAGWIYAPSTTSSSF